MYKVLIVEPQEFSVNALLSLPVWKVKTACCDGFECIAVAKNGQEAIDLAEKNDFDLILTEINLPLRDGLQVLKQVRKSNHPPLVVFISDIVTFAYAREGFIYGVFDYLPKPVSSTDMEKLFERADEELKRLQKQSFTVSHPVNYHFSPDQIKRMLYDFDQRDENVINKFKNMTRSIYGMSDARIHNPDMLISKLYLALIEGIYERNPWIQYYVPQSFHEQIDYLELEKSEDFVAFYLRKFKFLFEKYCVLNPAFDDKTLAQIQLYVLSHPEEDLRLATISSKFYLNHTYLSNLYGRKSTLHYSQLITLVKMHRAECLINYTGEPIEDISLRLGYKDLRYFLKLFQDVIGKSVSEYIRNEGQYVNYSI